MPESVNVLFEGASSVIRNWESAGELLADALNQYSRACKDMAALAPKNNVEAQHLASHIDSSLQNLHAKLTSRLGQSGAILARARNRTLSRFHSLPNEVIRQIFMDVVYAPAPSDQRYPPMAEAVETIRRRSGKLLSVCSSWRSIALCSGELWSFIPLGSNGQVRPSRSATNLLMNRARASPFVDHPLHLVAFPPSAYDLYMSVKQGQVLPRFTSVNIEGSKRQIELLIKSSLQHRSHGTWSELSIHQTQEPHNKREEDRPHTPSYYTSFGSEQNTFTDLVGSLSILRVRGAALMWHKFTSLNKLVELRLQSVVLGFTSAISRFFRLLESAPELQHLKMISVVAFPEAPVFADPVTGVFSFPKLQSLLLEDLDFNVLNFLLRSVSPGSHRLTLFLTPKVQRTYQADDYPTEVGNQLVYELLEKSRVDALLLHGHSERTMWLNDIELHRVLQSLSTLTSLKMTGWELNTANLLALKRSEAESLGTYPIPFPSLSHLSLSTCLINESDLEHLSQVVASHPLQSMELSPILSGSNLTDPLLHPIVQQFRSMVPHLRRARTGREIEEFTQGIWQLW